MSGILDNHTRVFDVLITQEGKRQIANGDLRIAYASFSDDATFYQEDVVSGSSDTSLRIFLEASNLPQDQITFEANDSGKLQPFKNINGLTVSNGQINKSTSQSTSGTTLSGSTITNQISSGQEFSSLADDLLLSSIDNFNSLRVLGTNNTLLNDNKFEVSSNDVTFQISEDKPIDSRFKKYNYLSTIDGLISDPRLSNSLNFQFLPPVDLQNNKLAKYIPYGLSDKLTVNDVVTELEYYDNIGFSKLIKFNRTSQQNNIVGQFFEISNNEIIKLDVIEFGKYPHKDKLNNINWLHIFFVGKVFVDQNGDDTFVHIFTLMFS